jgi:hypothetical protein
MLVFLSSDYGCYEVTPVNKQLARKQERATGNESVLFQTDWDFPRLAENLGWSLRKVQRKRGAGCHHHSTDGTVTCRECGLTASDFIRAAQEWLNKRTGDVFRAAMEDYFDC